MAKKETPHRFSILKAVVVLNVILTLCLVYHVMQLSNQTATLQNQIKENTPSEAFVSYKCDDGKTIQAAYLQNSVELTLSGGESMLLMQGVSASGVRYVNSNESVTFWNKGDTAFLEEGPNDTVTYNNCVQTKN